MLNKYLNQPTGNILIQLLRYFVSGGVAFVVDFSLLYILTEFVGLHYRLSTVIAFTVGLLITYLFSILWVFDSRRFKNAKLEITIFAFIGVVGLLLTSFFMWFFTDKFNVHYMLSKVFTTIIVFLWNFIMKKLTLFPKNGRKN